LGFGSTVKVVLSSRIQLHISGPPPERREYIWGLILKNYFYLLEGMASPDFDWKDG